MNSKNLGFQKAIRGFMQVPNSDVTCSFKNWCLMHARGNTTHSEHIIMKFVFSPHWNIVTICNFDSDWKM
jgi:hypothetical protein